MIEWQEAYDQLDRLRKFESEVYDNLWKVWRYSYDNEVELLWEEDIFEDEIKKQYGISVPKDGDLVKPKRRFSTMDALLIGGFRRDNRCLRRSVA
jgi:hypothetical protein